MKRFRWQWFLPVLQLVLAFAGLVYGPHEFRVRSRPKIVFQEDNSPTEYFSQNYPAPVERVSKGINFPALVLDYPLRENDHLIYSRNTSYTLIWISCREVGYFAGILVFWYWAGRKLDQSQGRSQRIARPRTLRIVGLTCGFVFAILTGAYALQMVTSKWRPERHIGAFGIVWTLALFTYFAWRATQDFRSENVR